MIILSNEIVYSNNEVDVHISNIQLQRSFFTLKVTLQKNMNNETIGIISDSIETFLTNANGTVYVVMNIVNCDFISLRQLEKIGNKLISLKPLFSKKLVATFIKCSNDIYWAKGIYSTLISFFRTLYTPVKPYEFFFDDNDLENLYNKFESITFSTDVHKTCTHSKLS